MTFFLRRLGLVTGAGMAFFALVPIQSATATPNLASLDARVAPCLRRWAESVPILRSAPVSNRTVVPFASGRLAQLTWTESSFGIPTTTECVAPTFRMRLRS